MDALTAASDEKSFELAEPTGLVWAAGCFFALRTAVVFVCVRVFGLDASTGSATNLALGFLLLLLVCFFSLGRAQRTVGSIVRLPAVAWVFAFLVFSLASLAWSQTVSLPTSFAYWCGLAADVAIIVLLFRAGSALAVSGALLQGFIAGACCLAMLAWILPADPVDLRLGDADYFNTNQIGNLCAVAILFAQCLMRLKQTRWKLPVVFLALTLLRSLSKTTLAAFLAAEAFLLLRDRSITRKTKLLLVAATLVAAFAYWGLYQAYFDIYTNAGNQAETLTGRTAIWATVLDAALDHPIAGHGFDSMWKVIPPFGPEAFEARHAENEVLQQFYAYGAAGVILLAGIYWSLWLAMRRLPRGPLRVALSSILVYVLVRGIAEAEPFDLLLPLWSIVVLSLLIEHAAAPQSASPLAGLAGENGIPAPAPGGAPAQTLFQA
jgi:exopolysaccharide production protein ExoQ